MTFPADDLPAKYATYFWSVLAVDRLHGTCCSIRSTASFVAKSGS
jgi:hypothetical protein